MFVKISALLLLCFGPVISEPPRPVQQYGVPFNRAVPSGPPGNVGGENYYNGNDHDHSQAMAYEFGYQVKDDVSGNNYGRQEKSNGNEVRGEYTVQLPDGRFQVVTYYADWHTGFHADVRYEGEPKYPDQYNSITLNGVSDVHGMPNNNGVNPENIPEASSVNHYRPPIDVNQENLNKVFPGNRYDFNTYNKRYDYNNIDSGGVTGTSHFGVNDGINFDSGYNINYNTNKPTSVYSASI